MVLIPEDENAEVEEDGDGEEEEEEGSSSREWMGSDVGEGFLLCGFDSLYDKYCQRMVVFDKMITQTLKDSGEKYSTLCSLYLVWLFRLVLHVELNATQCVLLCSFMLSGCPY